LIAIRLPFTGRVNDVALAPAGPALLIARLR
jgi:hypothetical protein